MHGLPINNITIRHLWALFYQFTIQLKLLVASSAVRCASMLAETGFAITELLGVSCLKIG